jgi:hypothetical protein
VRDDRRCVRRFDQHRVAASVELPEVHEHRWSVAPRDARRRRSGRPTRARSSRGTPRRPASRPRPAWRR